MWVLYRASTDFAGLVLVLYTARTCFAGLVWVLFMVITGFAGLVWEFFFCREISLSDFCLQIYSSSFSQVLVQRKAMFHEQ